MKSPRMLTMSPAGLENMHRVWVIITEIETDNWGIGGHRDWLRSYTSALDEIGRQGRGA
jgi:hypothetical protein